MLLKKGLAGNDVAALVKDLTTVGFPPDVVVGAVFNVYVKRAVEAFQSAHVGPNLIPLVVDGEVGPLTRWALDVALGKIKAPTVPDAPIAAAGARPQESSSAGWNALQVALKELKNGVGEKGSDNAGTDVMRFHGAAGGKSGQSWCASFVSYCFKEGNPGAMPFDPTTGARKLLQRFKAKGWDYKASVDHPPAPGDVIVWWRVKLSGWEGHVGLVAGYKDGIVTTIEGNRGSYPSKVKSFRYTLGQIDRLLGFGRAVP